MQKLMNWYDKIDLSKLMVFVYCFLTFLKIPYSPFLLQAMKRGFLYSFWELNDNPLTHSVRESLLEGTVYHPNDGRAFLKAGLGSTSDRRASWKAILTSGGAYFKLSVPGLGFPKPSLLLPVGLSFVLTAQVIVSFPSALNTTHLPSLQIFIKFC